MLACAFTVRIHPQGKTPSLKRLAKEYLGKDIQKGEHTPVRIGLAGMAHYIIYVGHECMGV